MFYFSHPFGISTPASANNNVSNEKPKKASKYTTTTYLVTEIQKNHSDGSQDESELKTTTKVKQSYTDRDLLPWPKDILLPPLIQLIERKHGKKIGSTICIKYYLLAGARDKKLSSVQSKHKQ